jgi:23S rRNA pseudouridine2605 synthase
MGLERIQKIIASSGICSRRAAEKLILEGRVKVDGNTVILGEKADISINKITVDDKPIFHEKKVYLLFYKPKNVITSMSDPEGRPIISDYIKIKGRVFPVGRLDFDSEGLLILTNDGEFANKLIHPRYKLEKCYRVKITGKIEKSSILKLEQGISFDGIKYQPAKVNIIKQNENTTWLEIIIKEGKYHQVKNMISAIGSSVLKLKRIRIGSLTLSGLKEGKYRTLTNKEILSLTN